VRHVLVPEVLQVRRVGELAHAVLLDRLQLVEPGPERRLLADEDRLLRQLVHEFGQQRRRQVLVRHHGGEVGQVEAAGEHRGALPQQLLLGTQ
jgi:hypothetical protein